MNFPLLVVLLPVTYVVHVLLHEAAHALMAWVLRVRVTEFVIGNGSRRHTTKIGRCAVSFTSWPFSGYVRICDARLTGFRSRCILIHLAGPLINLLLALVALRLMLRLPDAAHPQWERALFAFVATGGWIALNSLWPQSFHWPSGVVPNDMLNTWRILRFDDEKLRELLFAQQITYALQLREAKKLTRYRRWIGGLVRRASRESNPVLTLRLVASCWFPPCHPDMIATLRRLVTLEERVTAEWAAGVDAFACIPLAEDHPELVVEATILIRRLVQLYPEVITYQGTLGALLAEAEDWQGAKLVLEKVCAESKAPNDRAICSAYLAYVGMKIGNEEMRLGHEKIARSLETNQPIVSRVLAKVEALRGSSIA